MQSQENRRSFLGKMAAATLFTCTPIFHCARTRKKPNILFIAVDDLRPQLGCYGHAQMKSPNIDRLASEGFLASRSYCNVPVCGASRASLLTGMRPKRDRFVNYHTWADKDLPGNLSLPRYLKEQGYYTLSNGKVYHHQTDGEGSWSEAAWRPTNPDNNWRDYLSETNQRISRAHPDHRGLPYEAMEVEDNAYFDGKIADKTIEDLKRLRDKDQPFFLAAGFLKPHLPFNAPQKYWDLYDRETINMADNPFRPQNAPDAAMHNWGELRNYAGIPPTGPLDENLARTLVHGYYACVSYTDAQIGRILDTLDELDLSQNTIVILWGDHGWNLREHGLWCKHCNFNTSLQAPILLRAPGYQGGIESDGLIEFVDIYPTLCELAGLEIPEHCQGKSFVPLIKKPDQSWKSFVHSRFHNGESIRTDRHLYTEWHDDDGKMYARMLYDHVNDPKENVNISEDPTNQTLVAELSKLLNEHIQSTP